MIKGQYFVGYYAKKNYLSQIGPMYIVQVILGKINIDYFAGCP